MVVVVKGLVFVIVTVPVAEDKEIPVPDSRARTPLLFIVMSLVKAPPPVNPVPAITCVEEEKKCVELAILSFARVPIQTGVKVWVPFSEVIWRCMFVSVEVAKV